MGLSLMTVLEIAGNYPQNITIDATQDEETKKWASFMYMTNEDGSIHKIMLSFDTFPFESEKEAITAMGEIAEEAVKYYEDNYGEN